MTFRIGQKVVCVDDSPGVQTGERYLHRGVVYTIEGIDTHTDSGLILEGIPKTAKYRDGTYAGWARHRFRPLVERKTDTGMAILREILDRESHQDRVPERVRR